MKVELKLYRGYINEKQLVVFGHVVYAHATNEGMKEKQGMRYALSVIKMFFIKPMKNVEVTLQFNNITVTTRTIDDGYFRFDIPYANTLAPGWHEYTVTYKQEDFEIISKAELFKPYDSKLAIISDIDDTFLVSYSGNFLRKLYVMLYRNVNDRKIFNDVVKHYKLLSTSGQQEGAANAFFYVSSSEWNLYDLINDFAEIHKLPKAVIKLKDIKTGIADFLFTGRGSHNHKFYKIKDIISFYPNLTYVLLGDDSQHDAHIYEHIAKIFPNSIKAVYIRQTESSKKSEIINLLNNLESLGVATCYFSGSNEAIAHSKEIGIV